VAVGYGSDGPQSGKAVYDDLMQAASGIAGYSARLTRRRATRR